MLTWVDKAATRVRLTRYDRFAIWICERFWLYLLALGLMLAAGCVAVWRLP